MKREHNKLKFYSLLMLFTVLLYSCTDLNIEGSDSIISETTGGGFTGVADPASSIGDLYNSFYSNLESQENLNAMNVVTTDEQLIPTRGADWGDNGIWRQLHTHSWTPAHLFILRTWNDWNQNAFRASEIIETSSTTAAEAAEAKWQRALSMYHIMDVFGVVPFRGVDEGPEVDPKVLTRTEALDFILADLNDAIAGLPSRAAGAEAYTASKEVAKFLLAKVLLNKHIYNGSGSADNADMLQVMTLVDEIAAQGFALEAGYFDLFATAPDSESIWTIKSSIGNRIWNGMHYKMTAPDQSGGWNGFSTLAEFYDLFEGDANTNYVGDGQEERRGWVPDAGNADNTTNFGIGFGFLIGQQYDETGAPLTDRQGNPLTLKKQFPDIVGNDETTGIRIIKYHPVNGAFNQHQIAFRYSDAHLMKAEALWRSGGDPTVLVNELRTLRGAQPITSVTEQDLIDERGRELYIEQWRRNDLIRFGQYTKDWEFKNPAAVGDETKNLMPIPASALLSNPNLVQNPGY